MPDAKWVRSPKTSISAAPATTSPGRSIAAKRDRPSSWGESILHKRIYSMIRQATERGCQTHTTTNGTLLNEKNCQALINAA